MRIVQSDVSALRTELLKNDVAQRDALAQAVRMLAAISDSVSRISARTVGIQGDVRGEFRLVKEQLLQVQTLLGQSQANLNRLRAEMETRNSAAPPVTPPVNPSTVPPVTSAGTTPPVAAAATGAAVAATDTIPRAPGGPTASQLYQNGLDQLRRGSTSTARTYFRSCCRTTPRAISRPRPRTTSGSPSSAKRT